MSIIITFIFYPSAVVPFNGVPQHHNPLVHGFTVGPTPNPLLLFSSILLSKYDFPVRYKPATDTTEIGPLICEIKAAPSGWRIYSR